MAFTQTEKRVSSGAGGAGLELFAVFLGYFNYQWIAWACGITGAGLMIYACWPFVVKTRKYLANRRRRSRFRSPITFSSPSKYVKGFLANVNIVGLESKQVIEFTLTVLNGLDNDIAIKRHFIGEMVHDNTKLKLTDTAVNLIINDDGVISGGESNPITILQYLWTRRCFKNSGELQIRRPTIFPVGAASDSVHVS